MSFHPILEFVKPSTIEDLDMYQYNTLERHYINKLKKDIHDILNAKCNELYDKASGSEEVEELETLLKLIIQWVSMEDVEGYLNVDELCPMARDLLKPIELPRIMHHGDL